MLCCEEGNKLSCTLLTALFLSESSVSVLESNYSFKVRKESPECLFLSTLLWKRKKRFEPILAEDEEWKKSKTGKGVDVN